MSATKAFDLRAPEGQRDLEEPVGPDEIVGESGAERIAPPGGTRDMTATFANDGVVNQVEYRRVRGLRRRQRQSEPA